MRVKHNSEVWRRKAGENEVKERRMFERAPCRNPKGYRQKPK